MEKDTIKVTQEEVNKLCTLYQWLNSFVEEINTQDSSYLQYLEDKSFPNRHDDLGRIHQELDLYRSLSLKFWNSLNKDQRLRLAKIEKALQIKYRNTLNIQEIKAGVCEFRLKLDNPSNGNMMTSRLYTAYPEVRSRIYKQLYTILKNTEDVELQTMIEKTLLEEQESIEKRAADLSKTIQQMHNDPISKKQRYKNRKQKIKELRKADFKCHSNLNK